MSYHENCPQCSAAVPDPFEQSEYRQRYQHAQCPSCGAWLMFGWGFDADGRQSSWIAGRSPRCYWEWHESDERDPYSASEDSAWDAGYAAAERALKTPPR